MGEGLVENFCRTFGQVVKGGTFTGGNRPSARFGAVDGQSDGTLVGLRNRSDTYGTLQLIAAIQ